MKTPIAVIAGYLGAGKTTLLKRIIDNLDRKFAIIMNEFGDLAIDTEIIKGKNVNIAELAGGCVCCSLAGELEEAIKEILTTYNPEIIIVETTGVAEPDAIVVDIADNPLTKLDSIITIVDADALIRFPSMGRTGKLQIEMASILLLNKIDLTTEKQKQEVSKTIKNINKKAPIIETTKCDVDIDLLFGLEVDHYVSNVHKHKTTNMQSFTYECNDNLKKESVEAFLKQLPSEVYRAKGFLTINNKSHLINYVGGRFDIEPMESKSKNIVFIGENVETKKESIIKQFENLS